MRLLKPILTAIFAAVAVFTGLIAAVVVALTGMGLMLGRRMLRGKLGSRLPRHSPTRRASVPADVIDVTATEVPLDRSAR